jgi:AraC family transcriptional activator of tynA and feaB
LVHSAARNPAAPARRAESAAADIWSTEAVPARERFSYWRDVVCQAVLNVSTESPPAGFSARLTRRSFGDLRFASFDCTDHEIVRTPQQIARVPQDYYVITSHLRGRSTFNQGDEVVSLEPNEIAIVDGRQPFRIAYTETVSRAVVVIPHAMIDTRAPWLDRCPVRKLSGQSPFVQLARTHMRKLTVDGADLNESSAHLLTDNLCNLLALASARDVPSDQMQPRLQIEAMLTFCRQKLHDADLSPQDVADRFGISVRTLHLRFEKFGQTFGRWLLDNRLDACRTALRDPNQRNSNISEIAYRWGFNDLSHFNKAFRARFDQTPRECRNDLNDQRTH